MEMYSLSSESQIPQSPIVPIEFAGKWVAWNADETKIIASGDSYDEAFDAAHAAGECDPVLAKVPRADQRFVGKRGQA